MSRHSRSAVIRRGHIMLRIAQQRMRGALARRLEDVPHLRAKKKDTVNTLVCKRSDWRGHSDQPATGAAATHKRWKVTNIIKELEREQLESTADGSCVQHATSATTRTSPATNVATNRTKKDEKDKRTRSTFIRQKGAPPPLRLVGPFSFPSPSHLCNK